MPGQVIASRTSSGVMRAPGVSRPGADGTQDGICTKTLIGAAAASAAIMRTPSRPKTLAISCGSAKIAVVPCGSTARTYSVIVHMLLSTCRWPSVSPGARNRPSASITRVRSPMQ